MKILYITTIGKTMSFFRSFIKTLMDEGHQVELAANEINAPVPEYYREWNCVFHHIDFSRSPLSLANLKAIGQLKKVIKNGNYDIVHCHTPNASVITRLVCRKLRRKIGLKVFYTAHGFHFFKGAPLKNWLLYYPVEKVCSYFTDVLITINREDYQLAQKKMKASRIEYVPGVGVDVDKFRNIQVDRKQKRAELGIPDHATMLLSVGELNKNKNQQVIIRALAQLKNPDIHYAVAGVGNQEDILKKLALELGVAQQVHFLGYRQDVAELCHTADIFCFPSQREGLGLAAVEAMAAGLPVVAADNRGTREYMKNGENGFTCRYDDVTSFADAINRLHHNSLLRRSFGIINRDKSEKYAVEHIVSRMNELYRR